MTQPIDSVAGISVPLTWTTTTNGDGTSAYQAVSPDGSLSYTAWDVPPAGGLVTVDQLNETFPDLATAQAAVQADYDPKRRHAAWVTFFHTHEPPS
jgi:hypothetical protein